MIKTIRPLICLLLLMSIELKGQEVDFVRVEGQQFFKGDTPYYFLGANLWYGMHLGMAGAEGDRGRLIRELDRLQALGVDNLRIMGASEGPDTEPWRVVPSLQPKPGVYNESVFEGLDFLLAELAERNMTAVVCLNNFWAWSGGVSQYVSWANGRKIPYHPPEKGGSWLSYQSFTSSFFKNREAMQLFENYLTTLVNRVNTITGVLYKDDPTIMAWQLANEPRSFFNKRSFRRWIDKTARFIKSMDKQHLVSLGSEGNTNTKLAGTNFLKDQGSEYIDYTTIHLWIQNWSWYDPQKAEATFEQALMRAKKYVAAHVKMARTLDKPLVLEEFGIARDQESYESDFSTLYRDRYFTSLYESLYDYAEERSIAGSNFWAWGGEGRPEQPKAFWKRGDDLIGDPPHEHQGWYSVYDTDSTTLAVLSHFASMFRSLRK